MVARDLPDGWRWVRFGDVVRQVKDRVDPEAAGLERYVAGEHMDTDELRIRRWGEIGDGYLGPAFHMRFKSGHVLYGSRRTYLRKVAVADFEGICANTTFVMEPSTDDLLAEFLPQVMSTETFHEHSIKQSKGSVNPYINFKDLTWYEFPLPPVPEQREIANAVSAALSAVERLQQASLQLERLAEAVLEEATSARDVLQLQLGDVLAAPPRNGLTVDPTPDGEAWALTLGSLGLAGYVSGALKPIRMPAGDKFRAEPGSLYISRSNTHERVGMVCRVPEDEPQPLFFSDLLMRLDPVESTVPSWLLEYLLRTRSARNFIKKIAAGTSASMKKINGGNLARLPLSVPNKEDWPRIQRRLAEVDRTRASIQKHASMAKAVSVQLREQLLGVVH